MYICPACYSCYWHITSHSVLFVAEHPRVLYNMFWLSQLQLLRYVAQLGQLVLYMGRPLWMKIVFTDQPHLKSKPRHIFVPALLVAYPPQTSFVVTFKSLAGLYSNSSFSYSNSTSSNATMEQAIKAAKVGWALVWMPLRDLPLQDQVEVLPSHLSAGALQILALELRASPTAAERPRHHYFRLVFLTAFDGYCTFKLAC